MHEQLQDITHLIAFGCLLLMLLTGVAHYSRRSRLPAEAWTLIIGLGAGLTAKFTALDPKGWPSSEFILVSYKCSLTTELARVMPVFRALNQPSIYLMSALYVG
ncbi:MAG: hypothetical protein U5L00_02990 [Desulfovermiculus sp.]|nr:hypothetical protein [Desulfovermiculus sp.]